MTDEDLELEFEPEEESVLPLPNKIPVTPENPPNLTFAGFLLSVRLLKREGAWDLWLGGQVGKQPPIFQVKPVTNLDTLNSILLAFVNELSSLAASPTESVPPEKPVTATSSSPTTFATSSVPSASSGQLSLF